MQLNVTKALVIFVSLFLFSVNNAFAYEAGDRVVRVGLAYIAPNDDSEITKPAILSGEDVVEVEAGLSLGISGAYMVNDQFGVELLVSLPFTHDLEGKGLLDGVSIGETKHLPPTLTAQYYFDVGNEKIQPYAGIGFNYTTFFSEKLSSEAKVALTADDLELEDSFSYAIQLGVDLEVAENMGVNVSYWYADIETDATVKTATGDIEIEVGIDPHVFMLGGYCKF